MRSSILTKELMDLRDRFSDLSAEQRAIFLDLVDPQPEPQAAQKPLAKKSRKPRGRSVRAASLAGAIQGTAHPLDGGVSKMRCGRENCGEYADHNIHHLESAVDYHEFQPPVQAAVGGGGG